MNLTPEERERKLARRRELWKTSGYAEKRKAWRRTPAGKASRKKEWNKPKRKAYNYQYHKKWNKTEKGRALQKKHRHTPKRKEWWNRWVKQYYQTESYKQYRIRVYAQRRRLRREARLERTRADNMLRKFLYKIRLAEYQDWLNERGKAFKQQEPQAKPFIAVEEQKEMEVLEKNKPWLEDIGAYN